MNTLLFYLLNYDVTAVDGEEEEDGTDGGETRFDKSIMPEVVLTLQATNEFLKDRIMNLPEEKVQV